MVTRRDLFKLGATGLVVPTLGSMIAPEVSAIQATPGIASSGDVSMFRGNAGRTGEMPGPAPDPGQGIDLRWQFTTQAGGVHSSAAVVDGTVYFGSDDGNVHAVSLADGKEMWRFPTGDYVSSTPAVVDGTVYVGSDDQNCYAVDARTGEERWSIAIGSYPGSPAVMTGMVIIGGGEQGQMNLYAIDGQTGEERWRFATDAYVSLVPAVAGNTVILSTGSYLHALDLHTGEEIWRVSAEEWFNDGLAVTNDTVYVCDIGLLFALDLGDGTERWRTSPNQFTSGSIAVTDDAVFVANAEFHTVAAVDGHDGSRRWLYAIGGSEPDPAQPSRYGFQDVAVADGTVFATRAFNEVYAIDMRDGSERWTFQLHESGKNSLSVPVVVNGLVLLGCSDGTMSALGAP